ncbi:hypothetical protein HanXRQr2_Chr10g0450071 [Helianthus annuus]|uniref:Uncharacterized protein n=1 Tax=Helianthus annuus TaxID=4232 RepID=A0A9K3HZ40_HELAN|nr:hypothetical protein HanXRQr2_Chr10g0450071 [Helianthus annuus]
MRLQGVDHAPVSARKMMSAGCAQSSVFFILLGKMMSGGRACHFYSFSCIYVRFSCLFASFVTLSSFNPENTKGRQKHTFSNISTKKGCYFKLIYATIDVIYMSHFVHIKYPHT